MAQQGVPFHLKPLHKAALAVLVGASLAGLSLSSPVRALFRDTEYRVQDYFFLLRGERDVTHGPVLIVLVGEDSLTRYGRRSPTPRALLGEIVRTLNANGARCIGLDIKLNLAGGTGEDRILEQALAQSAGKVVLPVGAQPQFARHARLGTPEVILDGRDRVRQVVLKESDGTDSFASALYQTCVGRPLALPPELNPAAVPLDFIGIPGRVGETAPPLPLISAEELAVSPRHLLDGRYVLVGSGVEDLGDVFKTPFSTGASRYRSAFGVELQGTALHMLLTGNFLRPPPRWAEWLLTAFWLAALLSIVLANRMAVTVLVGPVWFLAWPVLAAWWFIQSGRLLPVAAPVVLAVLAFIAGEVLLLLTEQRHARFLRSTFSRYVSKDVVDELIEQRRSLDLGGRLERVTILFSDLEGFTSLAERLPPAEIVALLNVYFAAMTAAVFSEKGTVAGFAGDGLMAYFGAPINQQDHALRACRAALEMQGALSRLNRKAFKDFNPPLRMRIGLHSGEVIVGNVGSTQRVEFTLIGDAVNTASRLEGVNKPFGTRIIASHTVTDQCESELVSRELGRIVVKGRHAPLAVFELLGTRANGDTHVGHASARDRYHAALQLFYQGRLGEACHLFRDLADDVGDPSARFMAAQCEKTMPSPTGSWDGSITLDQK